MQAFYMKHQKLEYCSYEWVKLINSYVYFFKDCKHFLNCLVFEDKKNEAICTTKYLEAEKVKINEKPQSDAECLR